MVVDEHSYTTEKRSKTITCRTVLYEGTYTEYKRATYTERILAVYDTTQRVMNFSMDNSENMYYSHS